MRRVAGFVLFLAAIAIAAGQGTTADYERADSLNARLRNKVFRANVLPNWLDGGKRFWYSVEVAPERREYYLVDARRGVREKAFETDRLAKALGASGEGIAVNVQDYDAKSVTFLFKGKRYRVNRSTYSLDELSGSGETHALNSLPAFLPPKPSGSGEETTLTLENRAKYDVDVYWMSTSGEPVKYHSLKPGASVEQHTYAGHVWVFANADKRPLAAFEAVATPCLAVFEGPVMTRRDPNRTARDMSPDSSMRAILRDNNVWLAQQPSGEPVQLSLDGKTDDGYRGRVVWAPDSKHLLANRIEAGQDHKVTIVRSSPTDQLQPELITLDYLKPGDKIPHPRFVIFDPAAKKEIPVATELTPNPWELAEEHWSADGKELYYIYNQRGHQILRLLAADAATGKVRQILEEKSPTFIDYSGKMWIHYLDKTGEALWASEQRTGFNHIYLVNLKTGAIKAVTQGPWMVRSVESVDEDKRQMIIRVMGHNPGEDPYHMHYARVNFDGSGFTMLTEGDGTHRLTWAPDNDTYLDNYSRVDLPPVTELRRTSDGKLLCVLEKGDASGLASTGWTAPERFIAKGRDGKTDIYGIIIKPTNFDPSKKYPVIESVYAGPQDFFVPKSFSPYRSSARVAELGFIVVHIDGMGTNWRGKAFHDVCFKNLADGGFPDRILWMQAAAKTRPWMDLSRVGVFGTSAGGQNAGSAIFRFGDFYKAAVADCGCHDNRMDKIWWNEQWMGWPVDESYERNSNVTAAKNLTGKLYLMVGEVDTNVDPASTMQVVNALIKAGKDFDFLVVPNSNHGVLGQPYAFRRMEDFFVRALYGVEPRH